MPPHRAARPVERTCEPAALRRLDGDPVGLEDTLGDRRVAHYAGLVALFAAAARCVSCRPARGRRAFGLSRCRLAHRSAVSAPERLDKWKCRRGETGWIRPLRRT